MKPWHLIKLSFIFLVLFSCKNQDTNKTQNEEQEENSLETSELEKEMLVLQDSIISFRDKAFALESEKINSTTALIDEVQNVVSGYNPSIIAGLQKALEKVKTLNYNEKTLGDEAVMLAYDTVCDELLEQLNKLTNETEEFGKYVRANILVKDIIEANNQDLFIRRDYNFYVQQYNEKISKNSDLINDPQLSKEKYPLFYGEPES